MQDRIAHAKSYPFPSPDHGFVYEAGAWRALDGGDLDFAGRVPVLAAGSNQSPEQLIRKYGGDPEIGAIPGQRGLLSDFDVVYAAHLTAYGSLPATFQHSPGTTVRVFVLWLDDAQLERMHETERNYSYDHLDGIRIVFDDGGIANDAYAYSSKVGCYGHQGGCIALREIAATDRSFPEAGQVEALSLVRDRLAPGTPLDDFIEQHLVDRDLHRVRSGALAEGAIPIAYRRRMLVTL
jgi:hypothetical protein